MIITLKSSHLLDHSCSLLACFTNGVSGEGSHTPESDAYHKAIVSLALISRGPSMRLPISLLTVSPSFV